MTTGRSVIQDQLESELGITVTREKIDLPEGRAASECLSQVVDFLLEKGHLQTSDLPIKSGHKRYIVNFEPKHQNGGEMIRPKEIPQGVYVETNYNKEGIKRKIEYLVRITSD